MSDSNTPNSTTIKNISHTFPDLNGDAEEENEKSTDACMLFRPMFNKSVSSGTLKQPGSQTVSQSAREDALALAGRRGYERGFAEGQSEACELVQNELTPIFDDIKNTLIQYDEYRQRFTDIYSVNSLKLALAIVEKISGESAHLKMEDLNGVRNIIHQALQESFGLNLHFNPQDYKLIETMSACKNTLEWKQYQQVAIAEDEAVEPGTVGCSAKKMEWDTIDKQVALTLNKVMAANDNLLEE